MRNIIAALGLLAAVGCNVAAAAERMIEKQGVVQAPIAEVWKAWTTREGVKSFFAPDANIDARSGGPFEIYMNPYAEPGMKGADDMRFLALQEPTMLSFTWNRAAEPAGDPRATHRRDRPAPRGGRQAHRSHDPSPGLGRRREMGCDLRVLRSRLGRGPRQPAEALRRRPDRLHGVPRALEGPDTEKVALRWWSKRGGSTPVSALAAATCSGIIRLAVIGNR
jgi:uncharacterized protein YndB with AHSA1/START domain